MCGRYVSPDTAAIEATWHIGRVKSNPFPRRFNVLPTSMIPVIRLDEHSGEMALDEARWGFIPGWWKQAKPPSSCFNARVEEAAIKPMWRDAWRRWRCLIPACGWFEWQALERADPETGEIRAVRQPHFIYRADGRLVCFAGLISWRRTSDGAGQLSCAILTRDAAPSLRAVHDRMPVVLREEAFAGWLDPRQPPRRVEELVAEAQGHFVHHPVTPRLNAAKTDDEAFVAPLA